MQTHTLKQAYGCMKTLPHMHTHTLYLYLITMSSLKRDVGKLIELEILHIQASRNLRQCQTEGFFCDFQSLVC